MNVIAAILRELWGLFVDDGSLALAIAGIVAVTAILAFVLHAPTVLTGAFIAFGSLAALVVSTMSAGRR